MSSSISVSKSTLLVSESTLTARYQTTVPAPVRKALSLKKHEKIRYIIQANGQVILSRTDQHEGDPVLDQFLSFLAQDITDKPSRLNAIGSDLAEHVQELVSGVDIDLDRPLSDKDE